MSNKLVVTAAGVLDESKTINDLHLCNECRAALGLSPLGDAPADCKALPSYAEFAKSKHFEIVMRLSELNALTELKFRRLYDAWFVVANNLYLSEGSFLNCGDFIQTVWFGDEAFTFDEYEANWQSEDGGYLLPVSSLSCEIWDLVEVGMEWDTPAEFHALEKRVWSDFKRRCDAAVILAPDELKPSLVDFFGRMVYLSDFVELPLTV